MKSDVVAQGASPPGRSAFRGVGWVLLTAVFILGSVAPSYLSIFGPLLLLALVTEVRFPIRVTWPIGLAVFLVAFTTLSVLWSDYPDLSWAVAKASWAALGLFILITLGIKTRADLVRALGALAFAGVSVAIIIILLSVPSQVESEWANFYNSLDARWRLPWTSGNFASYSLLIGYAGLAAFIHLSRTRWKSWRLLGVIISLGLGIYAIQITGTRSVMLGFVGLIFVSLIGLRHPLAARRFAIALFVVACVVVFAGLLPLLAQWTGVESLFSRETGDLSGRFEIWSGAWNALVQQPLIGFGVEAYYLILPGGVGAHNVLFALALGIGLLGLTLYLGWMLSSMVQVGARSQYVDPGLSIVTACLVVASVPIWLSGVWEWAMMNWAAIGFCAAANSIAVRTSREEERESEVGRSENAVVKRTSVSGEFLG